MRKILFLLSLSLFVFVLSFAVRADAGPDSEKKLSATLRRQITEKNDYSAKPKAEKLKALKQMGLQEPESQIVFLHSKRKLSKGSLRSLKKLGVEVFEKSWVPPVEAVGGGTAHLTGFTIVKIPIDKINRVAGKPFVERMETAEQILMPLNDLAAEAINAPAVWNHGHIVTGVKIAFLDSGLDLSHADIPTPLFAVDYSSYPLIDNDVANHVTGHGTHVVGIGLGLGILSNSKYKGIAHGANLIFLKIGDDYSAGASFGAMSVAILDAVDIYGANIINISYGGFDPFKDGSDEICQAVDYARSKGVLVFCAAGNEGDKKRHYSATLSPSKTDCAEFTTIGGYLVFDLNWFDKIGVSNNLSVKVFDASEKEVTNLVSIFRGIESPRGTELIAMSGNLPEGTYHIHITNNSECEQMFHIYSLIPWVRFPKDDPMFTIQTPALADGAVAVGSWVTRTSWTNYLGQFYDFGGIIGSVSKFSSQGPRIDGLLKPDFVAPGEWIISARDEIHTLGGGADYLIIDNDGVNDGNGPADYLASQGTSMSAPVAVGGAAILISANPLGSPDGLLQIMRETASNGRNWRPDSGYGLINLELALERIEFSIPTPTPNETPTPEPSPTPTPIAGGDGGDEPPPKDVFEVRSTDPKDGAVDVELDSKIKIIFNQAINADPLALDRNGSGVEFRVKGTEVNLPVTLLPMPYPDTKKLLITPSEPMIPNTEYTLKIFERAVKAANAGGTQMVSDFKMSFYTKD